MDKIQPSFKQSFIYKTSMKILFTIRVVKKLQSSEKKFAANVHFQGRKNSTEL